MKLSSVLECVSMVALSVNPRSAVLVAAADEDGSTATAAAAADTVEDSKTEAEATKESAPAPGPVAAGSNVEIWWDMISRGHECSSDDIEIGDAETVEECAMRCAVFEGCQYFIFGHGDKKNLCWYESTTDGCRNDGHLVENDYSLYQIRDADVNNEVFHTLDSEYRYYRMVVSSARSQSENASFCVEDLIFYDGNYTPIDTSTGECDLDEIAAPGPTRDCCMSTSSIAEHGCAQAFDPAAADGWYCSASSVGWLGFQFVKPTYVHSYAVHDLYGVHALDPGSWTLQASLDGTSWVVLDVAENTPWVSDDGVYYNILGGISYNMMYREAECSSPDIMLGVVTSVEKCAEACANINGCEWFIYGKNDKAGRCYYEITEDGCESDGFPTRNDYDLYHIQRTGGEGDGGESVGEVVVSQAAEAPVSYCGTFFGSCANVFTLLFLVLTLIGGIWLVRSILRKRYARVSSGTGFEYDEGHRDESEA